jgi:hypothetical protein
MVAQRSGFEERSREIRETGLTIVEGLYKADLGRLAAAETGNVNFFKRPVRLLGTLGQSSEMHRGVDLSYTTLDIVRHHVVGTGRSLGLNLAPAEDEDASGIDSLEISAVGEVDQSYAIGPSRHGHQALALAVLDGELMIGFGDDESHLVGAGSAAFVNRDVHKGPIELGTHSGLNINLTRASALLISGVPTPIA